MHPPLRKSNGSAAAIKSRLVASGGRLAQEFGFNRVAGEVLASLYLTEGRRRWTNWRRSCT
jgi:hypothetical protein